MVDRVFKTILFFTPIAYCVGVHHFKFGVIFFQITSIILFISALFDTPKRQLNIKYLLAVFLGICLFSTIINGFKIKSLSALINIFLGIIDIAILTIYLEDPKRCIRWLLAGLALNTLIFMGQRFGYSPFIDPKTITGSDPKFIVAQYGGIIGNAPCFAMFVALIIPFISRWYLIPAFILGVFLGEASVFFSIYCVVFHDVLARYKICKDTKTDMAIFGLIVIPISCMAYFNQHIISSFSIRLPIWKDIINYLAFRPFVGFGLGVFSLADYGMSSFLQWIYGVGIVGLGFIALCIKRIRWYLLPLLFLCLFEYPFEIPRLWPVIIFTIAYFAIEQGEEKLC